MNPNVDRPQPRAVFLINFYMGGIRAGIQATHAMSRFHLAHPEGSPAMPLINEWNREPWVDLLNGGYDSELQETLGALEVLNAELARNPHPALPKGCGIPYAHFNEGQREMRGTLTSVVMLLPGEFFLRDECGDLPYDLAMLLKQSRRKRAETAIARTDLPIEHRVALLFESRGHAT